MLADWEQWQLDLPHALQSPSSSQLPFFSLTDPSCALLLVPSSRVQNNNRGGYNVGDRGANAAVLSQANQYGVRPPSITFDTATSVTDTNVQYQMVYYEGSELSVEWTAQHGCGGNEQNDPHKLNCDIILQYVRQF